MVEQKHNPSGQAEESLDKPILGVTRKKRFQIYRWGALLILVGAVLWSVVFLQPHRWYTYTDVVSFEQVARDVEVGFVLWEPAAPLDSDHWRDVDATEPDVSSDGRRMVYAASGKDGTMDLYLRRWDGQHWSAAKPMRALSSKFQEMSPSLSSDGRFLYFASDRPGGQGGYDIWIARWDGVEYAWPLPLTSRVNTPFDETGPAISPDNSWLYFASNRPRQRIEISEEPLTDKEIETLKTDFDLYAAMLAAHDPPYELSVERQLSMLYSLREGALNDEQVMQKLGGSAATENAVDKALAYLATKQSEDGRWDLAADGGAKGRDMAASGFALLTYYGRGCRHEQENPYQSVVKKGIDWLTEKQDKATGDLRGGFGGASMYDHAIAALALVEAYGVTKDPELKPRAQSAVDFIEEAQHEAGGWRYRPGEAGDLSVTGWVIMVLASAEMSGLQVQDKTFDGARAFLNSVSSGKHGGAFGYTNKSGNNGHTPAMNAVGLFCKQLLGLSSNSAAAWEGSGLVDKKGFSTDDLYYAYYGTLASYQHQGPAWQRWLEAMSEKLIKAQNGDGAWKASGPHGSQMGTIVATSMAALSLQAHYRYTPLYGLGFEPDPAGPADLSDRLIPYEDIPPAPLFRHAKQLPELSSKAQDTDPVVNGHGDFIYFASDRSGGEGGKDLYRARFERKIGDDGQEHMSPTIPINMGPEINSPGDEDAPALHQAGFQLIFNSARDTDSPLLYSAMSKRVERQYDYSKLPTAAWVSGNTGWLAVLACGLLTLFISTWFAIRKPAHLREGAA